MAHPPRRELSTGRRLIPVAWVFGIFVAVAVGVYLLDRQVLPLVFFLVIGVTVGSGMAVHALLRGPRRQVGQHVSLWIVGSALLVGAGSLGRQLFQIEGFFFAVAAGALSGVVIHYLSAKVIGPLLLGRVWCGWGCWTFMVLDALPWKRPAAAGPSRFGWVRYVHFAISLSLVTGLFFLFGVYPGDEWETSTAHLWFVGGNLLYYGTAIGLAVTLRDNRAFCKALCPVAVLLKLSARPSLLKVGTSQESCSGCGDCNTACPMSIDVRAYSQQGERVKCSECTLCQRCVAACPQQALALDLGFDLTLRDRFSSESAQDRELDQKFRSSV